MTDAQSKPGRIRLDEVVLKWPRIWEPQAYSPADKPAYSCHILAEKDSAQHKQIQQAICAVAKAAWGDKWEKALTEMAAADKLALRDGSRKAEFEIYEGKVFLSARTYTRPLCLGPDRAPLTETDGLLSDGAIVSASIDIWAQPARQRINCQLRALLHLREGEGGSGQVATVDEFADLAIPDSEPGDDALAGLL